MVKRCVICDESIFEEYGKLNGTLIKAKENNINSYIPVCSSCQKIDNWMEKALVKAA